MPWPAHLKQAVPQLLDSILYQAAALEILQQADPFIEFEKSDTWVRGREHPLKIAIINAVTPNKQTTGDLIDSINGIFVQVKQRLDEGMNGRRCFQTPSSPHRIALQA